MSRTLPGYAHVGLGDRYPDGVNVIVEIAKS